MRWALPHLWFRGCRIHRRSWHAPCISRFCRKSRRSWFCDPFSTRMICIGLVSSFPGQNLASIRSFSFWVLLLLVLMLMASSVWVLTKVVLVVVSSFVFPLHEDLGRFECDRGRAQSSPWVVLAAFSEVNALSSGGITALQPLQGGTFASHSSARDCDQGTFSPDNLGSNGAEIERIEKHDHRPPSYDTFHIEGMSYFIHGVDCRSCFLLCIILV